MKKIKFIFLATFLVGLFSCKQDAVPNEEAKDSAIVSNTYLNISPQKEDMLDYKNLRLYVVEGTAKFYEKNKTLSGLKTLSEAMEMPRFFITEKKPYGRFEDSGAVNALTIQNKTQDTIFLMAGDVVQGGNQDRLLAEDMIVLPESIRDIPVFCVEKGRWRYKQSEGEEDEAAKKKRKMFAFSGYYNVASADLRRTAIITKNQNKVWAKVGELTSLNNAESETKTYTNLENSEEFTRNRNEYLAFFKDKFETNKKAIGVMAVSGGKVMAVDIFNNNELFSKQINSLLHSYIIDAITKGEKVIVSEASMQRKIKSLEKDFIKEIEKNTKQSFKYEGQLVHYTKF